MWTRDRDALYIHVSVVQSSQQLRLLKFDLFPHTYLQGLFCKQRQLIQTDAPQIYYVDPVTVVLKEEIPW